jgi:hypothetical protein
MSRLARRQVNPHDPLMSRHPSTQSLEGTPIEHMERHARASSALEIAAVGQVIAVRLSVEEVARCKETLHRYDGLSESDRPYPASRLIDHDPLICHAKRCKETPARLAVGTGPLSTSTQEKDAKNDEGKPNPTARWRADAERKTLGHHAGSIPVACASVLQCTPTAGLQKFTRSMSANRDQPAALTR